MQAHPLSTSAARISLLPSTHSASRTASTLPATLLPNAPFSPSPQPASNAERPALHGLIAMPHMPAASLANAAGLAHDAGNLLSALRLYSDLLRVPGVLRPEHHHYAAELGLIAARSSTLIQRLISGSFAAQIALTQPNAAARLPDATRLGLLETGAATAHLSRPAAVLRALAPVLERIAEGAAVVYVATPCALQAATVPAEALERITVNLVRNAIEAIRCGREDRAAATLHDIGPSAHSEPGQIRVTLDLFASALRLTVEDNGPGMPPAVAAAFVRPGPVPVQAGRGLGHRIVHELIEGTGGKLSIRVRPGRGTALSVRWPLPGAGDAATC